MAHTLNDHHVKPNLVRNTLISQVDKDMHNRICKAVRRRRPVVLHEYCCGPDSLLARYARARGHGGERWHLQRGDLSTIRGVESVKSACLRDLRRGREVRLWMSLPWCAWQRVNLGRRGQEDPAEDCS